MPAVIVWLDNDRAQKLDLYLVEKRREHIQKLTKLSDSHAKRARQIAKESGAEAANEWLRINSTGRGSEGSRRGPSRASTLQAIVDKGLDELLKSTAKG